MTNSICRASGTDEQPAFDFRMHYLRKFGKGSLSYSSLQPDMEYFVEPGVGFISYCWLDMSKKNAVVLGDPICDAADREMLFSAFLKKIPNPVFIHLGHEAAATVAKLGFYVNEFGVETVLDAQKFDLVGTKKQHVRRSRNGGERDGLVVKELSADQIPVSEVEAVTREWRKRKAQSAQELSLLVRPFVYEDEPGVRKFYAFKDNRIVGFVVFDPIYENHKVVGYIANQLRASYDCSYSVPDFIILKALEQFKKEGIKHLSLGLSPMSDVADSHDSGLRHSKVLKHCFRLCFEHANFIYAFKNVSVHKKRYRPELPGATEQKIYCAVRNPFPMIAMYRVYVRMGLQPFKQTAQHVVRLVATGASRLAPRRDMADNAAAKQCLQLGMSDA